MNSQLLTKLLPGASEYEDSKNYLKDKYYKLKWAFTINKKELGYLTVKVRRAERDPHDPSKPLKVNGEIVYKKNWKFVTKLKGNLLTTAGRDFVHAQILTNVSAGTRGAGYIAVSVNAGGASAAHTAVAGEIAGTGLARADATTKTHTPGASTTQFIHTFTAAGGAHTAVQLAGTFNAASVGILVHENTFTPTTLADGDSIELTWNFSYS